MVDQIEPVAWMDEFGELFGAGCKPYVNAQPLYDEDGREASYRVGFEDGEQHAADGLADAQSQAFTYKRILDELSEKKITLAVIDVITERRRQVEAEGWHPAHDDAHRQGEIAGAAACYAMHDLSFTIPNTKLGHTVAMLVKDLWPWAASWWKPADRRRNLIKAAALIVAEIERIDRADPTTSSGVSDNG